jgi:ABC-type lipoprotein export system ATPase subunit
MDGRSATVRQIFGIGNDKTILTILEPLNIPLRGITFISGMSGAGKSTLLKCIVSARKDAVQLSEEHIDPTMPIIDLLGANIPETIRWMSSFGLGEARLMVTPFASLSEGQKLRVRLALLLWKKPQCIAIDEFLSVLDRLTARLVAFHFQKVCRRNGIDAYLATAHEDLVEPLGPDQWIKLEFGGASSPQKISTSHPNLPELDDIVYGKGSAADYHSLGRFHYIEHLASEAPLSQLEWAQTVQQVRVARYKGRVVAAAVFSRPLPKEFEKNLFFSDLNRYVIVVLRVIVHPLFRGVGLTKKLLIPELTTETRCLVACSALGFFFPFFLGAGFERVLHPRNLRYGEHEELEKHLAELSSAELQRLNSYESAQSYYDSLLSERRLLLRNIVKRICIRSNVDYCLFMAQSAGIPSEGQSRLPALITFFERMIDQVPEAEFGSLLSEALYFPVQGFIKLCKS